MGFFLLSYHASRRLLRSSLSSTSSFIQPQHISHPKSAITAYLKPIPKCPSWNYNAELWSKGVELHQERLLVVGWNHRLVAGISSSSPQPSALDMKPKKEEKEKSVAGVQEASWIDLYLPKQARGYAKLARLDKPIGIWLHVWPCMWSIALAADPGSLPDLQLMALLGFGAVPLRGASCTMNDLLDRDIDAKVERTRSRPLASGLLTPFQGLAFLGLQLLLPLGVLLQLNNFSQYLGAPCLLLILTYPLMKRITFWPQAYLGLYINWGALLGWAAVKGSLEPAIVFPLYVSGICWTIVYDTIYAHQDKKDDVKAGVKSTALKFGDNTKLWLTGFGTASMGLLALSGFNADIGWPYYLSLMAASGQLAWQIRTVDLSSPADCNRKFVSNKWFGAIIFSGILLGKAFQ